MLQMITILILFFLVVCAFFIMFKKIANFRQQSKNLRERESEFIYRLVAEGELKPHQAFRMDDFAESRATQEENFKVKKPDSESSIDELRSAILERINGLSEEKLQQLMEYLDEGQMPEQRKYDRKDFIRVLDYSVDGRYYRDVIRDISESGMFIKTAQTFSKGQKILMTFTSIDHQSPFKINGEIVHIHQDGIGVTFKLKSQVQQLVLKSIIEKIQNSQDTKES